MTLKELIAKNDPENQYNVLLNYYQQINSSWFREISLSPETLNFTPGTIIISGMGGSAISGNLFKNFSRDELNIPLEIVRSYQLPPYANEKTLLIASSYSGNTEETISALEEGIERGCKIICVTTGGRMKEIAEANSLSLVTLFPGFQPRFSIGQSFFSLLKIFQILKLIPSQDEFVENVMKMWKSKSESYGTFDGELIEQAIKILGKTSIIYSASGVTDSIGMRLKGQLNENSKKMAFHNEYPELNHNEIISFENVDVPGSFVVINILDDSYNKRVAKRYDITTSLIQKKGIETISIQSSENSYRKRLLDLILKADWLSYYVAVFGGKDPSEIDYIHFLKKELSS